METIIAKGNSINILGLNDVIEIHETLSNTPIEGLDDPIEPRGIKSRNLLESAISRQTTGSGTWYKYDNALLNCSTLIFGIIKNHAFHNGNKRAGLMCMLKHLYLNGYVLKPIMRHDDIYKFIVAISDNKLPEFIESSKTKRFKEWKSKYISQYGKDYDISEFSVNFGEIWLKEYTCSKNIQAPTMIKISKLKSILEKKGITLEQNGAKIRVYQLLKMEKKILGITIPIGEKKINEKEYSLGNSLTELGHATLNYLRRDFNLLSRDGVDNIVFYDEENFIDTEITKYKKLIYRLSRT